MTVIEPGTTGTKLMYGVWIDRWDPLNYPGHPQPALAVVREWVDALRSGEYAQASRTLAAVNVFSEQKSYCCLGVLCELAHAKNKVARRVSGTTIEYDDQYAILPESVKHWAGTYDATWIVSIVLQKNTQHGVVHEDIEGATLVYASELNDAIRLTFAQIADILEYRYLPKEN